MDVVQLSSRTGRVTSFVDPVRKCSGQVDVNRYHEKDNPQGIVDLCMSQNTLISDVVLEKLHQPEMLQWDKKMLMYTEKQGTPRLRKAVADYLRDQTKAPQPVDPDKMCIMNGVTAIISCLGFVLFEEGDTILLPSPSYYSTPRDIYYTAGVKTFPAIVSSKPGPKGEAPFELTVDILEQALEQATQKGHRVRGAFFVNPSNPLGTVYTKDQVRAYLKFCHKHKLHAIFDEIYQGSIHDESTANSSLLGLPLEDILDKQRTHFLYGFSKDFAIPGAPVGLVYSWNKAVIDVCVTMNDFQLASSFIQKALAKVLEDKDWVRGTFFPTNMSRMRDASRVAMATLDEIGATYVTPRAGLFIWANLSKFLAKATEEEEEKFSRHLLKCGVGLSPSAGYCGGEYGWYRIMFAVPRQELTEGLRRLKKACLSAQGEE